MVKNILEAFAGLPDPRWDHPNKLHRMIDIVVIAICGTLAKCESWEEIADYGEEKEGLFKRFLDLPNGIPSHDTFNRLFSQLDPVAWQRCFMVWMQSMSSLSADKLVALDGKTLRGTKQSGTGKREAEQTALELVTAWLSENELVLAQLAVPQGSNEISVIPDLLELLDLEGATVTLDAMGCHKDITDTIIKQGGQYLLSLKRNHKLLFQAVADLFEDTLNSATTLDKAGSFDVAHGRQEERTCYVLPVAPHAERFKLADCDLTPWTHLQTFIMVEATTLRQGEVSTHRRFFLSSLSCSAAEALTKVRQHWSIENQQHYPLDVLFHEDASRNRKGFLAQNVAALRRLSLNLLNLDTSTKLSKRRKRLKALLDDDYLLSLLGIQLSH